MSVSLFGGQFRSAKECNFRLTGQQQYPGMLCEVNTGIFRVPQNELDSRGQLIQAALYERCLSFRRLQLFVSKPVSMTVAIRLVSLWTHGMFAVLGDLEKSGLCVVDQDSRANMLGRVEKVAECVRLLARWAVTACTTLRGGLDARVVGCVIRRMGWCHEHDLIHLPRGGGGCSR